MSEEIKPQMPTGKEVSEAELIKRAQDRKNLTTVLAQSAFPVGIPFFGETIIGAGMTKLEMVAMHIYAHGEYTIEGAFEEATNFLGTAQTYLTKDQ